VKYIIIMCNKNDGFIIGFQINRRFQSVLNARVTIYIYIYRGECKVGTAIPQRRYIYLLNTNQLIISK